MTNMKVISRLLRIITFTVVFSLSPILPTRAASTFVVNSNIDDVDANPGDGVCETLPGNGICTVRAAIQEANTLPGEDTVILPSGTYLLTLPYQEDENLSAASDLDISAGHGSLAIVGSGAGTTTIDGNAIDRVFDIRLRASIVSISGVTIQNGYAPNGCGGGIFNTATLTLTDVILKNNSSQSSGAIYNAGLGVLTIINSTISDNTARSSNGGGIATMADVSLTNVTINNNEAEAGGGIDILDPDGTTAEGMSLAIPTITLTNVTISNNRASSEGGGIRNIRGTVNIYSSTIVSNTSSGIANGSAFGFPSGALNVKNTLLANNSENKDCYGPIFSWGHNLIRNPSGCTISGDTNSNLVGVDPLINILEDNGGPTRTIAPMTNSPAIDTGDNTGCPTTDERGFSRPRDGDGNGSEICDIGAYELQPPSNLPPTVDVGGPYQMDENGLIVINASGNDPENRILTYAWDLDNNGSFETPGQMLSFSAAGLDGPNNHIIAVQVTDSGNLTAIDQAVINVMNVAPIASFAHASGTAIEGGSVTFAFSDQLDPSSADTVAGFLYSYDCTADNAFEASDTTATSHVCIYPNSGTFTARGRIEDKDGSFNDYNIVITVLTAQQAIVLIIDDVEDLIETGLLKKGSGNALISNLKNAIKRLDNGQTNSAIQQLQAFMAQVNDYINDGALLPDQGQPLINEANGIIAVLVESL